MVLQTNFAQEANEMFSSKIRSTIIVLTAAAAVSATALPAVASAAAVKRPAGVTRTVPVKPVAAEKKMEAGSAGIPGYSDATCQSLLNDYNTAVTSSEQALLAGASSNSGEVANRIYGQLTDNCLVVD
jgi:hypothetical protein